MTKTSMSFFRRLDDDCHRFFERLNLNRSRALFLISSGFGAVVTTVCVILGLPLPSSLIVGGCLTLLMAVFLAILEWLN